MALEQEIEQNRRKIHTDSYPMSIGEMINLYQEDELDIHPEFQRIYRWDIEQKSKLIESILLGIPLPSFFVAQRDNGVWDVVDGLQRLSTIFSFVGILKDENGNLVSPLKLQGTEYLPSLEGKVWTAQNGAEDELTIDIKRAFKREKIDLKIIKRESESHAKYDLFQRLNTGGSSLSPQEVRNCLLIMIDHTKYDWLKELSEYDKFVNCLPITDKQANEQYYMELALRFIVYKHTDLEFLSGYRGDISDYITDRMKTIFDPSEVLNLDEEADSFRKVFNLLDEVLSDNSFRKFNVHKNKYEGGFSVALFEVIAVGLGLSSRINETDFIKQKIGEVSTNIAENPDFLDNTYHGIRALQRSKKLVELGKSLFQ